MGDMEHSTKAVLEASRFWVQKVLVPTLVFMGLAGNILTVMVLTRKRMRSSTNIYLTALALADIIYLIFGLLLSFQHYDINEVKHELYWKCYGLMSWLFDAASATSAWLAVSFTVERYIAVCHPIKGRVFCTERKAKSIIAIIYIFCTLTTASINFEYTLSFNETCTRNCSPGEIPSSLGNNAKNVTNSHLDNVPSHIINLTYDSSNANVSFVDAYFQAQLKSILANCTSNPHIIYVPIYPQSKNVTISETNFLERKLLNEPPAPLQTAEHILDMSIRSAKENNSALDPGRNVTDNFTTPGNVTCCRNNMTVHVVETPFGKNQFYKNFRNWYSAIVLIIIPLVLLATFNSLLIRAVYMSRRMRRVMTNSQDNNSVQNEKRITNMLIAIVIIFLICNTPNASHCIYYYFHDPVTSVEMNICRILGNFFNLLVMINAPCNFIVYCLLSKKFRSTIKQIFWERRKAAKQSETETILLSKMKSTNKFNPYKHGVVKRNASEYRTPRNLETQSLTSIPRSRSLMVRPVGKAKSSDLNV